MQPDDYEEEAQPDDDDDDDLEIAGGISFRIRFS
jgi:hypothetical protein